MAAFTARFVLGTRGDDQALTLYPVVDFALLGLSMAYLGVLP